MRELRKVDDVNEEAELGRRERNKNAKRERIVAAATELFAEHGFSGVTTQQISDRADVAAGTLFRYAANKAELILMVENATFEAALDAGTAAAAVHTDVIDAITALVLPVLERGMEHPENTAAYQREILYGSPDEPHRARALRMIEALQAETERILRRSDAGISPLAAETAARSVFAVIHLALVSERFPTPDRHRLVQGQVAQIVRGASATADPRA